MSESTFHLVSLGCAKNDVDSDSMEQLLLRDGYRSVAQPAAADILIVNTCGFIGPAKRESIQVLRTMATDKRPNQLLIAAGCLTQRYGADVARQVPGIDGILGTRRWMDIVSLVRFALKQEQVLEPFKDVVNYRFDAWLAAQAQAGRTFTDEQIQWLHMIRDQVAASVSVEPEDFEYAPFYEHGGRLKARELFGDVLEPLLGELSGALVC